MHTGDMVSIYGFRPLEHRRNWTLVDSGDRKELGLVMQSLFTDPELAGMEIVGWYRSQSRGGIYLTAEDVQLLNSTFIEPWQIAMILQPVDRQTLKIGFFFREPDGSLRTRQSYREFSYEIPMALSNLPALRWNPAQHPAAAGTALARIFSHSDPGTPAGSPLRTSAWKWSALIMAFLLAGIALYSVYNTQSADPELGLQLAPGDGTLLIQWDAKNPALSSVSKGALSIADGAHRSTLPLMRREFAAGRHTYKPLTNRVDVKLIVMLPGGRMRQESAVFTTAPGIGAGRSSLSLLQAEQARIEALQEVLKLRTQLLAKEKEAQWRTPDRGDQPQAFPPPQAFPKNDAEPRKAPARPFLPPANVSPDPATPAKELPGAPEIASGASPASPLPVLGVDSRRLPAGPPVSAPPANPQPPVASNALVKPAYTGPASGNIIWVGDLPRNGSLTIEGLQASTGVVNIGLPGVPVRISAFPAELTNAVLKVFTANPAFSDGRTFPPSSANGWMKTIYLYSTKSARELALERAPDANGPQRIVLRAGEHRLGAIMIEWQLAKQW